MNGDLEVPDRGRVWFVTESSSGFGRALAGALLEHDDRLVATARDTSTIADLASVHPERTCVLELDVTSRERVCAGRCDDAGFWMHDEVERAGHVQRLAGAPAPVMAALSHRSTPRSKA